MAAVLLIGSDSALLEGLAQTLAGAGHRPRLADSPAQAAEQTPTAPPLVTVAERSTAVDALRLPLARGGALIVYRAGDAPAGPLPAVAQRAVLADLALPLERHRLLALVAYVEERATRTGRARNETPGEHRAL
jgi:DNA-binding NtrC family response regulator